MPIRGIRGAVRAKSNTRKDIFDATRKLMRAVLRANRVQAADVAACFFTTTADLNADFPAYAARDLALQASPDWKYVPMMCGVEIDVPGSMRRVIRMLILVNTPASPRKIRHQYLGEAASLRPDLAGKKKARGRK